MAESASPFREALERFKRDHLKQTEKEQFQWTDFDSLKVSIKEIQAEQASKNKMRNWGRLKAFLEGMEQYEKLIEVFLNASNYLAFVWGPMKFLLQVTKNFVHAFDDLLDMYQQIGEQINFSRMWRKLFDSTWKTFQTRFSEPIENFKRHRNLIESQATLEQFEAIQLIRNAQAEQLREQREEARRQRRARVRPWLAAEDMRSEQEYHSTVRQEFPGTGRWIIKKRLVKEWLDLETKCEALLWLTGIPGAGKTTLASVIIEEASKQVDTKVVFFYCKNEVPQRNTFLSIARSLLYQLSFNDDDLTEYLDAELANSGETTLKTAMLAKKLLDVSVRNKNNRLIVIDGLDECLQREKQSIISSFQTLISGDVQATLEDNLVDPTHDDGKTRCLVVGREDGDCFKLLKDVSTVKIQPSDNRDDIRVFCQTWEDRIREKYTGVEIKAGSITNNVTTHARDMFLFAKLVMANLFAQRKVFRLQQEIHWLKEGKHWDSVISKLDEAYGRILRRIENDMEKEEREDVLKILSWIVCAERDLGWHEIQGAMSLDLTSRTVDFNGRCLHGTSKDLCGSLVEIRSGNIISLVHASAKHYLIKQGTVIPVKGHLMLTTICFSYLSLPHFDASLQPDAIKEHIMQGRYAFSDYTLAHWLDHLESTINELYTSSRIDTSSEVDTLAETANHFLQRDFSKPTESLVSAAFMKRFKSFEPFLSYNLVKDLAQATYTWSSRISQQSKDRDNDLDGVDSMSLEISISSLRKALDSLGQSEANTAKSNDLHRFHGTKLFKCAATGCRFFHEGFKSLAEKNSHQDRHKNAYVCNFDGCLESLFGFPKLDSLKTHILEAHRTIEIGNSSHPEFPITQDPKAIDIQDAVTKRDFARVRRWAEQFGDYIPGDGIGLNADKPFETAYGYVQRKATIAIALASRDIKIITFLLGKVRDIEKFQIGLLYKCSRDFPAFEVFDWLLNLPVRTKTHQELYRLMRYGVLSRDEQLALRVLRYFGSYPGNLQETPANSRRFLNLMAKHGFSHCLKFLLEDIGLDAYLVDKSKKTVLMTAAERGHVAIVQLLLSGKHCKEETIEFSRDGITAAMLAAANGHESITQLFFPDGGKLGDLQRMLDIIALRRATIEGEVDTVRRILALRDFPFDLLDFSGCDPFLHAVEKGYTAIVEMFLSLAERFDINRRYSYSYSGLEKTTRKGDGPTALIIATLYGHEEIVKLLLERDDLDIEADTRTRWTVKWNGRWSPRMTALQIAESKGLTQIIQLLQAKKNPT